MEQLEKRNQQLIDIVIEKVQQDYAEDIDLIGVYGSFITGDYHERSDLDLLVVLNNDKGYGFSTCFILHEIGYDLYGSTWSKLEDIATFDHTFTAELIDAEIVYYRNKESMERFQQLQQQALDIINSPMTPDMVQKAKKHLDDGILAYGKMMLAEDIGAVRMALGDVVYYSFNVISLLNHSYYKYGVKRQLEEAVAMAYVPENLRTQIDEFLQAESVKKIKDNAGKLIKSVKKLYEEIAAETIPKLEPTKEKLRGTYEEIWSNWYNKVLYAAEQKDTLLAFSAGVSCQDFYDEMHNNCGTVRINLMQHFEQCDLGSFAAAFENAMNQYKMEYDKVGLKVRKYDSVAALRAGYL
ncbi:nucleotidyltransferase domain-containing protein [Gracilibacillus oryzae]|uniref:Nucleotidyltransferase domain-containing protein n=1 Tax=Gracilibacillus oryzae TaxID=1672701 RepID=A0A7C8GUC3_9BACI|nr:nucleotidyltransferase domain-containing protein [Gracilibacillus oryzae]KAB8138101.1 nucleotidyltransferase domain-containing protein [Gracilibacillus oryzae]